MSFLRYTPGAKPGVAPKRKAPEVTPPAEKRRAYEMKRKPRTFQSHWRDGRPWLMVVTDGGNPVSMFCQYCRDKFSVRSDMVRTSHLSMIAGPKDHLCKILKALTEGPCSHSSGIVTRDLINSDFLPLSSTGSPSHLETYLLYINDKPSVISSQACLFADDCILYRVIRTAQDQLELQEDLDNLEQWAKKWGVAFNVKKCEISHLSHSSFYTPLVVTSRKKSTRPNT